MSKLLVLNAGSSSLKYQVFEQHKLELLCSGAIEEIGKEKAHVKFKRFDLDGEQQPKQSDRSIKDHQAALEYVLELLSEQGKAIL